eukprot:TRINITY_DN1903_c2_g1_i1.p1 TRINITY_DN1903_c2_g1~~TRINITY_DN1903_c2_g1_i1.p1  ORF type:complete len:55 (+),score=2.14 TRINITY_DN1903_c2_g1_i1:304-468(+)
MTKEVMDKEAYFCIYSSTPAQILQNTITFLPNSNKYHREISQCAKIISISNQCG